MVLEVLIIGLEIIVIIVAIEIWSYKTVLVQYLSDFFNTDCFTMDRKNGT